ncbi:MAG: barstar family protein [Clostridia bacterium]|nr:barstar family protein [Clostridia bacterium]
MEQEKNIYTVDFKDVHNYLEIHSALKKGLDLPDYYGANLDALWDCLTDFIDNDDVIILKNYQFVEKASEEYAKKILDVFKDAKHYSNDAFTRARIIVERDGVETEIA